LKNKKIYLILILIITVLGCNKLSRENTTVPQSTETGEVITETLPDKKGSIVELPKIAKLSLDELDKLFGQPEWKNNSNPVRSYRDYIINKGDAELRITIKDKSISSIVLKLTHPRDSLEDALRAGGFNFESIEPDWENKIVKIFKEREFNGVKFKEIKVGVNPSKNVYEEIRVRIRQ
jgi:hypothetical protein